jgi:predicted porin
MKKSLLALAVLGAFTGVASAQSSLTIYGKVDQAFGHKAGENDAYWADSGARSRLGFKGTEDLGGGLKANFVLEHSLNPDEGAANALFWHGQAWVGLSHSTYGSLAIGRQYTAAFSLAQNTVDPFNGDGYASLRDVMLVNEEVGSSGKAGLNEIRYNNSIRYDYSGYGINAALSLKQRGNTTDEPDGKGDRSMSAAVNYTMGKLFLAAGVENTANAAFNTTTMAWSGVGSYLVTLGAKYDLGFATVSAGYSTGAKDANTDVSGWLIGARVPYGRADFKVGFASSKVDGADGLNKFAMGVDYNLSKRTKVYADYARLGGDATQNMTTTKNAWLIGLQTNF